MTDQEMAKNFQEIWNLFKETDKRFKETDQRLRETNQRIEAITGKWGRFVEGLLVPAVERLFKDRGIEVERVFQRARAHKNGRQMEIDVLAVNQDYVVVIEVKSTLGVEDVMEHLKRLSQFKAFFPEYANRKVIGAVAGIAIDENADRFAYKSGLFVIGQSGETARILNDEKFIPRTW